jgi:hypothetical protein
MGRRAWSSVRPLREEVPAGCRVSADPEAAGSPYPGSASDSRVGVTSGPSAWQAAAISRTAWLLSAAVAAAAVWVCTRVDFAQAPSVIRVMALAGLSLASLYLALLPGLAVLSLAGRREATLGLATSFGVVIASASAVGLITFWAWFVNPDLGVGTSIAFVVAAALTVALFGPTSARPYAVLAWPFATAIAVELIFLGLAYVQGGLAGQPDAATQTIAVRFWVAPDNKIPYIVANLLAAHAPLGGYLFGGWQASDRPPLQSGLALLEYPLFGNRDLGYQVLATGLQLLWIPALWVLLRAIGFSDRRVVVPVLATAFTGAVFVNSIYTWPKMLSGALILAALAVAVSRDRRDQRFGSITIATSAAVLAFLSHGGAAYTLLGLLPLLAVLVLRRRAWLEAGLAAVAALVIYLPWFAFQRLIDPPGDRLLYWQLAGLTGISDLKTPFLTALVNQYRAAGLMGTLVDKAGNVAALVARPDLWATSAANPAWTHDLLGLGRIAQLTDLLCAAGPLVLGALVIFGSRHRAALAPLRPVLWFALLSIISWVVIQFGSRESASIITQGPYAILVLVIGLLALCVTYLPRGVAVSLLAVSLVWFVVEWVPGISFVPAIGAPPGPAPLEKSMVLLSLVGVAGVGLVVARVFRLGPSFHTQAGSGGEQGTRRGAGRLT